MNILPASLDAAAIVPHPLQLEMDELRRRLEEAEETLLAIRQGEVDAVIVKGESGPQVYTLLNADRPYRNIVERMQEGAFTLTPDGTILYVNQRLALFLGLALTKIVGQRFARFVAADDRDLFGELLGAGGQVGGKELSLRSETGEVIPVHLSLVDLPDEGQRIISGIATDLRWQKQRIRELAEANDRLIAVMAERERAETMLRHAQKMEAIGQLTAGIAHDFNNLLMVISGNLELFHKRVEDAWLKARVETSQRAIERGARLTQQLLAFASRQSLRPEALSVNALLVDIEPLLRSALGDTIRLTLSFSENLAPCLIDSSELQAAILNLAANARDAMPGGGSLTIATADAELDAGQGSAAEPISAGTYLSITVTDTGHGMPAEIRERVFDPFFTTKEIGKGTGLGLSRIYGFMHQSGGHVTIESTIGIGTSVRLYFLRRVPVVVPEPAVAIESVRGAPVARRILVVEDDCDLCELVAETLRGRGYVVVVAENGPEALKLLDSGVAIDAIVSDVLMPEGMSGFELAREIRRRLPLVAIVLTSGMTGNADAAEDAMPDWPVLRKPYRSVDLVRAIEAAVTANPPKQMRKFRKP